MVKATPVVWVPMGLRTNWFRAAGVIEIPVSEPGVTPPVVEAVMDCVPTVFRVALNVPVPFVSVELAGKTACGSELLKLTVPL